MATIIEHKEKSAVQAHINMLQGIIKRMAANSANCKTLAITILAALLALYADDKICSSNLWICYIPTGLFFFLDCYYLGLERQFIRKQEKFVDKINNNDEFEKDLFAVNADEENCFWKTIWLSIKKFFGQLWQTAKGIFSFSTLPFYGFMIGFIYFISR
jgi:hypothetical protein